MTSYLALTAGLVALIASGVAAGSAAAGESDNYLGLGSSGWDATAPADEAAARELAPVFEVEPEVGPSDPEAYRLLIAGPSDERMLIETLRAVEPSGSRRPAARAGSGRPTAPASPVTLEDPGGLVARKLGLDGIDPGDLTE